jgi:2-C-methyl-D-erythritol 4-phosphate cytidylyltransferase/2-C-methyl-D-erythritol 2,4-cyclodiphosphate synthase
VTIPHRLGLEGHSDGDALLHALTDALMGAVGGPDIGSLFPSDDERWKGAPSRIFVEEALEILGTRGYRVAQVDAVIIGEEPRLAGYYGEIRESVAAILGLSSAEVGIKATTTDGMGFAGRREGMAAQVVALLEGSRNR